MRKEPMMAACQRPRTGRAGAAGGPNLGAVTLVVQSDSGAMDPISTCETAVREPEWIWCFCSSAPSQRPRSCRCRRRSCWARSPLWRDRRLAAARCRDRRQYPRRGGQLGHRSLCLDLAHAPAFARGGQVSAGLPLVQSLGHLVPAAQLAAGGGRSADARRRCAANCIRPLCAARARLAKPLDISSSY